MLIPPHRLAFGLLAATLFGGCKAPLPSPPEAPKTAKTAPSAPPDTGAPPGTLGRAGPITLDLAGLRAAVLEVQVLGRWRGRPAPVEALDDPLVRRRILTRALENQLIRDEVTRRGLTPGPQAVERALVNALAGRGPGHAVDALPDGALLEARVAARFEAPVSRVRRVAADLLGSEALAQALLAEVPEARIKADWLAAQTTRTWEVWRVSRVPTTREIDRAERTQSAEIERWYAAHRSRFNQPARISLRRVFVRGTSAESRARLLALRARLEKGEDFEQLARAQSEGPQARRGGTVGSLAEKRLAWAKGLPVGALSPIIEERGGLAIYRIDRRLPATGRAVDEPAVRREVAATLLREADALPTAKALAAQVRQRLARDPNDPALARLVEARKVRRHVTEQFDQDGPEALPGVGLAPDAFKAAFAAQPGAVEGPFTVRQHYLVFRVLEARAADPAGWPAARTDYSARWREAKRGTVVDRWLSKVLEGQPMWVDGPALRALTRADLLAE